MADLHSSQDNYAYEAEQERLAEMKGLHQPMKKWYARQAGAEPKWGAFPLFWQDLGTWTPFREVCVRYCASVAQQ
jgi:splicing factor 1